MERVSLRGEVMAGSRRGLDGASRVREGYGRVRGGGAGGCEMAGSCGQVNGRSGGVIGGGEGLESGGVERLRELCGEFEGIFLAQVLRIMRRSGLKSEFLHGGIAEDVFMDQFCMAVGRRMGKAGGIGLAEMLYRQLVGLVDAGRMVRQKERGGAVEVGQRDE